MSKKSGHSRVDGMIRDNLTGITFKEGISQTELYSMAARMIAHELSVKTGQPVSASDTRARNRAYRVVTRALDEGLIVPTDRPGNPQGRKSWDPNARDLTGASEAKDEAETADENEPEFRQQMRELISEISERYMTEDDETLLARAMVHLVGTDAFGGEAKMIVGLIALTRNLEENGIAEVADRVGMVGALMMAFALGRMFEDEQLAAPWLAVAREPHEGEFLSSETIRTG